MTPPRGGARLLDSRWHWLSDAVRRLYRELEDGDKVAGLSLSVYSGRGGGMVYGLTPGEPEVHRLVVPDPEAAFDAMAGVIGDHVVDATPDLDTPESW